MRPENVPAARPIGSIEKSSGAAKRSVMEAMPVARPLFHQKQKSIRDVAMSQTCQKRL